MSKTDKLEFDKFSVEINPENLRFDEATLSNYIQNEGGYYDNYGYYLALAERNLQNKENAHEKLFCDRFVEAKDNGSSDKLAEAKAKSDADVVALKEDIVEAKFVVNRLKNHIKAWDKNHDNAQSMGHMLRKQMDRLNGDIMGSHGYQGSNVDYQVSRTVSSFEPVANKQETGFDSNIGIEGLV